MKWVLAVSCWSVGLIWLVMPPPVLAASTVTVGDVQFSFGHVVILCGVFLAWGDQRATMREMRREFYQHMKDHHRDTE